MKNSFVLYHAYAEHFEHLSDEELGQLMRAVFTYAETGAVTEFDNRAIAITFSFIKKDLDIDREKYEARCEKNRENGEKGGRGNKKVESERKNTKSEKSERFFEKPKKADNDNENENDNEHDNEAEAVITPACADDAPAASAALGEIMELYKQNIHPVPGSLVAQKIADWLEDVDASLVRYAIEQAVAHEKRTWAYIEKILQSHFASGRKTALEASRAAPKKGKKSEEKPGRYDFQDFEKRAFESVNGIGKGGSREEESG